MKQFCNITNPVVIFMFFLFTSCGGGGGTNSPSIPNKIPSTKKSNLNLETKIKPIQKKEIACENSLNLTIPPTSKDTVLKNYLFIFLNLNHKKISNLEDADIAIECLINELKKGK